MTRFVTDYFTNAFQCWLNTIIAHLDKSSLSMEGAAARYMARAPISGSSPTYPRFRHHCLQLTSAFAFFSSSLQQQPKNNNHEPNHPTFSISRIAQNYRRKANFHSPPHNRSRRIRTTRWSLSRSRRLWNQSIHASNTIKEGGPAPKSGVQPTE